MIGTGKKFKVIAPKRGFINDKDVKEHINLGICINTLGDYMIPYIIFDRLTLPMIIQNLILSKKVIVGGSSKGWITKECFKNWCVCFSNFVTEQRKKYQLEDQKSVLYLDGHNSRLTYEGLNLLKSNNIIVKCIPSHTSHVCLFCATPDLG